MEIDAATLREDLVRVGAFLGPVGLLLGLASGDALTAELSALVGALCALRLLTDVLSDGLTPYAGGPALYAGAAIAAALAVVLGAWPLALACLAASEVGAVVMVCGATAPTAAPARA